MKIAFVLDDTLDSTDGVQQYIITLGGWLLKNGHDVHYIVGSTQRRDIANIHSFSGKVKVRFNRNKLSIPLPASPKKIHRLLTAEQFDVLHVQMPYSPMLAARVISLAPKRTAIVGTFHIAPYSRFEKAATSLLGYALRPNLVHFDEVISVSRAAQEISSHAFKVDSRIIPNTFVMKDFAVDALESHKSPTIVFLGRLVARKGAHHLLRSIHLLVKHAPEYEGVHVLICGDGPDRPKLEAYAKKSGLNNMVTFVGLVTEQEKRHYLASADIAVFPSTSGESFGIVLLEAMAAAQMGAVVLGGNNPGYSEVLAPTPEAIFDPHNHAKFADKISLYLGSASEREKLHKAQKKLVASYDVSSVGPKIVTVYKRAIEKRTKSTHNTK